MAATATPAVRRPRRTELQHYPSGGRRFLCLGIVVLATIVLYYQFYLAGAVAAGINGHNGILPDYNMSFTYYVNIAVVGYFLGAAASFVSGFADKYGRVNIITSGLLVVALLCLVGIPLADSKLGFALVFGAIGLVEGVILVATPALIRDFSPQLGRASAMGFWTLGPVLGSLVVSIQVSSSSDNTAWHKHYVAAGIVGLVVAVLSALFLRELTPELRDQVMVSARDRALVEARAAGIDVEASLKKPFRQMLKPDIIGSAFAISVFLIIYYIAVGFFPVFFQTVFGYTPSRANALGNWNWSINAAALLVIGFISDKVRVRKPFMIIGAIGAIVFTSLFALRATHPDTSYSTFVWLLVGISFFLGLAYAPWMASFTETVEKRNPALTATGLAVWGLVIRIVIAITVFFVPHVVNTVSTLVEKGGAVQAGAVPGFTPAENATVKAIAADPSLVEKIQATATKYAKPLAAAQKVQPATLAALQKNPDDAATGAQAVSQISGVPVADVAKLAAVSKVDQATLAALKANPADQAAGVKAVSEISGVAPADVATIATLNAQHGPAIAAAQAIDSATITTLLTDKTNTAALAKATQEITSKLNISAADAQTRLADLASIPIPQLLLLQSSGQKVVDAQSALVAAASIPADQVAKVQSASADLQALAKIPPAELAPVSKYGPSLQEPKVQKILTEVSKAKEESPKQWRNYFWIAVAGEVVFIPLIFLLVGAWSPKTARRREQEHEEMVQRELARIGKA